MSSPSVQPDPSSTGLDPKVAGLLCYLGAFVTGIIFLVIEKKSRYVRLHAFQSIVVFGSIFVLNIILNFIPLIGTLISFLLTPISFILWIVLMLLALQGKLGKLPIIGDWSEKQVEKF